MLKHDPVFKFWRDEWAPIANRAWSPLTKKKDKIFEVSDAENVLNMMSNLDDTEATPDDKDANEIIRKLLAQISQPPPADGENANSQQAQISQPQPAEQTIPKNANLQQEQMNPKENENSQQDTEAQIAQPPPAVRQSTEER